MKRPEWANVALLTVLLSLSACQRQESAVAEEEAPAEVEEQMDATIVLEGSVQSVDQDPNVVD